MSLFPNNAPITVQDTPIITKNITIQVKRVIINANDANIMYMQILQASSI